MCSDRPERPDTESGPQIYVTGPGRQARRWALIILSFLLINISPCVALALQDDDGDALEYLKSLSIEELLQTEVTSVSKKSEQLFDTAAAVFVITQEDIKRAGVRTIPDALRMVPGLQVAHINASTFAITARGFNEWFSNKLLVLVDGRSVYTPLFSGVYWDLQDTVLEDIDRIEVIRGPGATMWGANAVNGVINIITKHSEKTQGGMIAAGAGNIEKPLIAARYGGNVGQDGTYRVYAKGFRRDGFVNPDGGEGEDEWRSLRTGFRMDVPLSTRDALTLQGESYSGASEFDLRLSGYLTPPFIRETHEEADYKGGHLITTWQRRLSDRSNFEVKGYYDWYYRDQIVIEERRNTANVDFKHHLKLPIAHEIVWGLGYRWTEDDTERSANLWMDPDSRCDQLWNAFVQDDIMVWPDRVWLTLGSKFEHNDYSGFEVQPNARLRWKPTLKHTVWASVSRSVRTPSRSDHDIRVNLTSANIPPAGLTVLRITGDEGFDSEELTAYEAGFRWQKHPILSIDLAGYYNVYDNLRVIESGTAFVETSPGPPHVVIPQVIRNGAQGETYGLEALTTWMPLPRWKLSLGYAWFGADLETSGNNADGEDEITPRHQWQLRSYLDLPWALSLDTEIYFVDELDSFDIPAYTRVDLRLGWDPTADWSFSLNIENALDDQHPEFPTRSGVVATEVPRIIYGQLIYRF